MATSTATGTSQVLHPLYEKNFYAYSLIRDALEGQDTVKRANQIYLPIPSGMIDPDNSPAPSQQNALNNNFLTYQTLARQMDQYDLPAYHTNPAYSAYLQRANFPGFTASTFIGLMGLVLKHNPTVSLPARMQYLLDNATPTGLNLNQLYQHCVGQVLSYGRMPLSLDPSKAYNDRINIVPYNALSFINWQQEYDQESSEVETTLAVFEELAFGEEDDLPTTTDPDAEPDTQYADEHGIIPLTEFDHGSTLCSRVLRLNPATKLYESATFVDGNQRGLAVTPTFQGTPLTYIPLQVIGSTNNDITPDIAPLKGLAELAIQHYAIDADLRQAEFMSCNPTLCMTGVNTDESPRRIGATVALAFERPEARVFYTTTDTAALQHLVNHQDRIEKQAKAYGGNLLTATNARQAEAAESLRIRQSAAGATLASVVDNVNAGLTSLLKDIGVWMGLPQNQIDSISFEGSKEFTDSVLSSQEQDALVNSWVSGAISQETVIHNFQKAGLLAEGVSVEDELNRAIEQAHERAEMIQPGALAPEQEENDEEDLNDEPEDDDGSSNSNSNSGSTSSDDSSNEDDDESADS